MGTTRSIQCAQRVLKRIKMDNCSQRIAWRFNWRINWRIWCDRIWWSRNLHPNKYCWRL